MGKPKYIIKAVTMMIGLSALAGLFYLQAAAGPDKSLSSFSHTDHTDLVPDCADCHALQASGEPGRPGENKCSECHDDGRTVEPGHSGMSRAGAQTVFSHKTHRKTDCSLCHALVEKQPPSFPGYRDCASCHKNLGVKSSCGTCHVLPFTPSFHAKGLWTKNHGLDGEPKESAVHGKDCGGCHPQPACTSCHRTVKPRSHTGFFRIRGHGLSATVNGETCKTCHRESFCVRCHRETRPLNHSGNWAYSHGYAMPGGYDGTIGTCAVCHQASWCAACHTRKK